LCDFSSVHLSFLRGEINIEALRRISRRGGSGFIAPLVLFDSTGL
jgi:hypothetical protein